LFSATAGAQNNFTSKAQVPLPAAFGEPGSINVSAAVGSFSETIPLVVPPGRRGLKPRLALSYGSMVGSGDTGLGWSVAAGRVERWRGDGTPSVGLPDRYSYSLSGAGGELRDLDEDGVYRARVESVYRPFTKEGSGWGMYDGQGTYYSFGSTVHSRIDGELWLIDRVEDPHGNTITYHYINGPGVGNDALYLSEIRYTGYVSGDTGANSVVFEYEDRPDKRVSYLRGVLEANNLRLQRITMLAQGNLVRRYELGYDRYAEGPSRLRNVTLVGTDDISKVTLRTFEYGERPFGWANSTSIALPLGLLDEEEKGTGVSVMDVNGDGFADVVGNGEEAETGDDKDNIYLGDGQGNFTMSPAWSASLQAANVQFVGDGGIDTGVRLLDVNGDGRPDLFIATQALSEVRLNTGNGWQTDLAMTASLAGLSGLTIAYADLNDPISGCLAPHCDDLGPNPPAGCTPAHCVPEIPAIPETDEDPGVPAVPAVPAGCTIPPSIPVHCSVDSDALNCQPDHCVAPNFPTDPNATENFALIGTDGQSKGVELADVNGDGLIDIVWSLSYDGSLFLFESPRFVRAVFLNSGPDNPGWQQNNLLASALAVLPDAFVAENRYGGYSFQDVNGDGFSDIVRSIEDKQAIYLGNGTGWALDSGFTDSMINNGIFALDSEQIGQGFVPMDFNDDGLLDYVRANGETYQAFVNTGTGWAPNAAMTQVLTDLEVAFASAEGKGTGTTMADINGDGVGDLITAVENGVQNRIVLSDTLRSGKLVRATSTLGEVTEIAWTTSTRFDNTTSSGIQGLPFAMTVVHQVKRLDGRGNVLTTDFDYTGGLFVDRSFRGFYWSEEKPSVGLRNETVYYQQEDLSSQPMEISAYDSAGLRRVFGTSKVVLVSDGPYVKQVQLQETESWRFDPGDPGSSSHSKTVKTYDDRLQILSTFKDADVGPSGDERTTTFTWARNAATGIWGFPVRSQELGPAGELMSETISFYDDTLIEGQVSRGLPTEMREFVESGVYVTRQLKYDHYGNPTEFINRTGDKTTFTYDATWTFRTGSVDALGRELHSEYDPRFGLLTRDENASGNATTTEYDVFGRITTIMAPGDEGSTFGSRSYVYSPLGDPQQQFFHSMVTENADTDEVFETTTLFDGLGNIYETRTEGPDGKTVIMLVEFSQDGQAVEASLPFFEGDTPAMLYTERDDVGRTVRVEDTLGAVTTIDYAGLLVEVEDARGIKTSWTSNPDGESTEVRLTVDGVEQKTNYTYDVLGRLTQVVDALGNETLISYDGLGRRTRLEDPNAGTYHYYYDAEGHLIEQVGPDGGSLLMRYSKTGELLEKELPDGTIQSFRYGAPGTPNGVGELVEVNDAAGKLELKYDERGHVIERRRSVDGRTYVTGFAYDSFDRVHRVTYPDGFIVNYSYDAGNNLASITDKDGRPLAAGFQYNASSRITEFTFGNGVTSEYRYDDLVRMISARSFTDTGKDLQELVYAFDSANNVLSLDDLTTGSSQEFDYDEANRLVRALGPYGEESYEYDEIGNLLKKGKLHFAHDPQYPQRVSCGVEVGNANGNGESKSPKVDPCAASIGTIDPTQVARSFALTYDGRGNVVTKGSRSFEYDGENRLLGVRAPNGKLIESNRYDASGELVVQETSSEKKVFIDGIYEEGRSHASRHIYAGPLLVATLVTPLSKVSLIETTDPEVNFAGFSFLGSLLILLLAANRFFGWRMHRGLAGFGLACRAQPGKVLLAFMLIITSFPTTTMAKSEGQDNSEKIYYYHSNHLGSVNVITDEDSRVTARRDYRPYGDPYEWSGAQAGPRELLHTFQGQKLDDNTGLYNFKARHYDAELGRFMSADTVVSDTGDPRTLHRYAFAGGNPVKFVDPTGRSFWSSIGDAFVSAGNWIADNAVEILTVLVIVLVVVALVALTVLTGGLATAALLGAAAGFATFGGIALSQGKTIASAEFWQAAATGAVLGALVFSAGFLIATGASGVLAGAIIGAATGGLEQAIACASGCGGVENLLLPVAQGVLIGGIWGAIGGGVAGKWLPRGGSWNKTALRFMIEPGKFGLVVKSSYSTFSQANTGLGPSGRRTAYGDVIRLLKAGVEGESASTLAEADTSSFVFGTLDNAGTGLTTAPNTP
jgi:RHS repeat-associated protein